VVEALVPLWEASDRLCGKVAPCPLPQLVESLEHHGHLQLEQGVRARVLTMSSATCPVSTKWAGAMSLSHTG